eukprot:GHVU01081539.1.p2 GENE.GHVU01081539.1~~GHVU01081539.1.p2  ORF type:complete len:166 (-),score=19.85 GHVU01081539.1:468-965(-)
MCVCVCALLRSRGRAGGGASATDHYHSYSQWMSGAVLPAAGGLGLGGNSAGLKSQQDSGNCALPVQRETYVNAPARYFPQERVDAAEPKRGGSSRRNARPVPGQAGSMRSSGGHEGMSSQGDAVGMSQDSITAFEDFGLVGSHTQLTQQSVGDLMMLTTKSNRGV